MPGTCLSSEHREDQGEIVGSAKTAGVVPSCRAGRLGLGPGRSSLTNRKRGSEILGKVYNPTKGGDSALSSVNNGGHKYGRITVSGKWTNSTRRFCCLCRYVGVLHLAWYSQTRKRSFKASYSVNVAARLKIWPRRMSSLNLRNPRF
jgi:hypothetical protein